MAANPDKTLIKSGWSNQVLNADLDSAICIARKPPPG